MFLPFFRLFAGFMPARARTGERRKQEAVSKAGWRRYSFEPRHDRQDGIIVDMKSNHAAAPIAMIVLASLSLALMDAATKYMAGVVSVATVLIFRYGVQATLMAIWVAHSRGRSGFVTLHPRFQILRGVLLAGISVLAFFSLRVMPLGEFTAIIMLAPVLFTALSGWMLREPVSGVRWLLVLGGFIGTLIVIRPGSGIFGAAVVLPVLTMLAITAYNLITSRLAVLENPHTTQFYTGVVGSVLLLPLVALQAEAFFSGLQGMPLVHLALLLFIGAGSATGHLLVVMAFGRAGAASLMPFTYAQIGFAALISWLAFRHAPDFWAWTGMVLIAACGMTTGWLNMRALPRPQPLAGREAA